MGDARRIKEVPKEETSGGRAQKRVSQEASGEDDLLELLTLTSSFSQWGAAGGEGRGRGWGARIEVRAISRGV